MRQRMKAFAVPALTFFLVITAIIVAVLWHKSMERNAVENRASPNLEFATDQNMPDDFVSRSLFDDEENEKRANLLRFELERDGAWAELDCRVADRFGNPVPNASIRFYFNVPENRSENEGIVEGKTNQDGRFHARHMAENRLLTNAKSAKNDEFYTQYTTMNATGIAHIRSCKGMCSLLLVLAMALFCRNGLSAANSQPWQRQMVI